LLAHAPRPNVPKVSNEPEAVCKPIIDIDPPPAPPAPFQSIAVLRHAISRDGSSSDSSPPILASLPAKLERVTPTNRMPFGTG